MTFYFDNKTKHIRKQYGRREKLFCAELVVYIYIYIYIYIYSNACLPIEECVIVFVLFDNGYCRK